ncbi:hypothetical protein BZJ19_01770 [Salinivibrio proteolyticus]|uniref:PilZ domain-containing protein n=1 Tax=Salinivibrio proteolyticus TaxID=334715 RepID=UPI0009894918|nr:PilZ domain-containing protein [Salinivibrio proteolyticus]OOF27529.1 hypothetical protein BZJ19_01770 [Salinivibrio proteolyticus]
MPRQEQLNAIEQRDDVIALSGSQAALKLGSAALVRMHVHTPMKGLFRFNAIMLGTDGKRYCYTQIPSLSAQQKGQYLNPGFQVRLHGVAADGSLVRFSGKVQGVLESHCSIVCIELLREGATATPLRQDKRFPVALSATLATEGMSKIEVEIRDLSVGGCLFAYRSMGAKLAPEKKATLNLDHIAPNQDLTLNGSILSHRLLSDDYLCGFQFDDRSKARSTWLITNLAFDGTYYRLAVTNNKGETSLNWS